jgi:hypothetical protein
LTLRGGDEPPALEEPMSQYDKISRGYRRARQLAHIGKSNNEHMEMWCTVVDALIQYLEWPESEWLPSAAMPDGLQDVFRKENKAIAGDVTLRIDGRDAVVVKISVEQAGADVWKLYCLDSALIEVNLEKWETLDKFFEEASVAIAAHARAAGAQGGA